MEQIAEGVYLLDGFPKHAINVYLIGDVLLDAGISFDKRRILRQLAGHDVRAHALTHAHPDHMGASRAVCQALDIPFWCPAGDEAMAETGDMTGQLPDSAGPVLRWQTRTFAPPRHTVDRVLQAGDEVGGFTVIATPGHSLGHVSYWREQDRLLIAGDVFFNLSPRTFRSGLSEPPAAFTVDPAQNRESMRTLAALEPQTICFGHGAPLRNGTRLQRFVEQMSNVPT